MKRTCKRLISMLLAFVMLFAMFGMAQTVYALDHIQNVSSLGGVLKWSAFPGAKCYYFSFGTGGGYATSPFDMKAFFAKIGKDSGTYNISLYALDGYLDEGGKQISEKWTSKYTYTSTQTKLATPTNLKWSGNVASWSAVPYAQKYELALYRDGNRTRIIGGLTSTSIDLSNYYAEGTHTYKFSIAAKAEGYITSQEAVSPSVTRTGDLPAL